MKYLFLFLFTVPLVARSQDEMSLLGSSDTTKDYVTATFKGSHIINFQSVEVLGKHSLEFMIQHRFGDINGGANSFFGLDNGASIRFGLSYSNNGRLEFGIGRTNVDKLADGYLKYKLLRQTVQHGMPVSVTLFGSTYCTLIKDAEKETNGFDKYHYFSDRLAYTMQAIVARKFSDKLSVQLSPTYIHYNLVDRITDKNNVWALGSAFRYKFTNRMAVTAEYGWKYKSYTESKYYNTLGIGWEIETGGHVFQMFITNSTGIADPQFVPHTTTSWKDGGIRLGFNISRLFNL